MTFELAEKMVADNLYITSTHSRLQDFPYYLKDLVIVPVDADLETKMKVYNECLSNGQNNRDALISLGLFDKEQDVMIMGSDGKSTSPYSLEKYLEEAQYKS